MNSKMKKVFEEWKRQFLKKKNGLQKLVKALDFNEGRKTRRVFGALKQNLFFKEENGGFKDHLKKISENLMKNMENSVKNKENNNRINQENESRVQNNLNIFSIKNEENCNKNNKIIKKTEKIDRETRQLNEKRKIFSILKLFYFKKWEYIEKKYKSLNFFKMSLLNKSFTNLKWFVEIRQKKFLIRRKIYKMFETRFKSKVFSIFLTIFKKKKEEFKKILMKITEKKQRKLFFLFRTAIFQQKKQKNHQKNILKIFQTIKIKKIMTLWRNRTKKNELFRNEKKLSLISYKILMFSSFFQIMKPILIIRKKLKRIKKHQAKALKLKFFTLYKRAFKFSKFPRFFKKIDNKI